MVAEVELFYGTAGARRIALAPLTGAAERGSAGPDELLACLARPGSDCVHGEALHELTAGDRDRALAGLYDAMYGSAIVADAACQACNARYEMRFNLRSLRDSRRPEAAALGDPPAVRVGDSLLRLPRQVDLAGTPADLLARLTLAGPVPDVETAARALEAADPALELDLAGQCPACGTRQTVPFSMCGFLGTALRRDRTFLAREVHLIASRYHWGLGDILALTRDERHELVRLLIAEREAASQPMRHAA